MICYRCGCTLSEKDYCTGCGADVGMYKKVLVLSNRYYNDALEKCQVRDLTGAISSLKQSIKLNKNNVDARNLLGLVYFEIGEITESLGQWVISKNIRDTKNIAADYLDLIQENPTSLTNMDQNLKKFNQSLALCYQDSLDYAVIQLKKILSVAPKYLKAHQLLALIYIKNEEWEKAKREVEKCEQIDSGSTITLKYKQEIESVLAPIDGGKGKKKKNDSYGSAGVNVYRTETDTIIQPINNRQSSVLNTLLNMGIGLIIGIAITYFLILPSKIYSVNESAKAEIATISDEKDKKASELDALSQKVSQTENENAQLKEQLSAYESSEDSIAASDALMIAVKVYLTNPADIGSIASALENLEDDEGNLSQAYSEDSTALYNTLMDLVGNRLSAYYYSIAAADYNVENYEAALPNMRRAYRYDKSNSDALFFVASSYRHLDEVDKAKELYALLIENFPGTEKAIKAETYLAELNAQ